MEICPLSSWQKNFANIRSHIAGCIGKYAFKRLARLASRQSTSANVRSYVATGEYSLKRSALSAIVIGPKLATRPLRARTRMFPTSPSPIFRVTFAAVGAQGLSDVWSSLYLRVSARPAVPFGKRWTFFQAERPGDVFSQSLQYKAKTIERQHMLILLSAIRAKEQRMLRFKRDSLNSLELFHASRSMMRDACVSDTFKLQ
ncbi:hypothetical protein BST61_g6830 [Cercospora zeina]